MLKSWIIRRQFSPSHLLTVSQCPLTGTSFPSGPFRSCGPRSVSVDHVTNPTRLVYCYGIDFAENRDRHFFLPSVF